MKRIIYKIIPFILIFIVLFSVPVGATEIGDIGNYPLRYVNQTFQGLSGAELANQFYYYAQTQKQCLGWAPPENNDVFFLIVKTGEDDCKALIGQSNFYVNNINSVYTLGDTVRIYCRGNAVHSYMVDGKFDSAYALSPWDKFTITVGVHEILYCNYDIYNNAGDIKFIDKTPSETVDIPTGGKQERPELNFPSFDGPSFSDWWDDNYIDDKPVIDEAHQSIQQETLETQDNTPNVFMRIFQKMSDMLSSIYNVIDNTRSILYGFVTGFSSKVMGFFESALAAIADKIDSIDYGLQEFYGVMYQIHSTGLDEEGNFSLSVLFKYWLVPSENYFSDSLSNVVDSVPVISSIVYAANTLYSVLSNLEAVAPVITIPPLTVGEFYFPGMNITFEWFEAWKPYTDAVLTVLIYYGFIIHLIKNLPNIISATPSVPAEKDEPLQSNWQGGIYRK